MLYTDIVGQEQTTKRLRKLVDENRVPHALLFSGREGCGSLPTAIAFAQHLFCKNRNETGACNTCPSCLKVSKLAHPDLHLVFPIAQSQDIKTSEPYLPEFREMFLNNPYVGLSDWFSEINAENKIPLISVSEASEILKKLSYTSFEGSYRIVIIWHAEKMNAQSANSILKILEEPNDKTIFILTTEQPEQLLATILSRVQQIPFVNCSMDEITSALIHRHSKTKEQAREISFLSGGNYAEAIRLVNEPDESETSYLQNFQSFMRLAFNFDCNKIVPWVEENASLGREGHKQFFKYGLEVFRDCLMYNYGNVDLVRLTGSEKSFLEKFAPFINHKNYEGLIEEFNTNYYYVERYANPKILFMDLFIKCNALIVAGKSN